MTVTVMPRVIVVMGVSGSGKSTIAEGLAKHLGWPFQEGDALHPPANVAKMRAGIPLDDADRWPWLALVAAWIGARLDGGEDGIITCSALKRAYREQIAGGREGVSFLYLHASRAALEAHVKQRQHEYMPSSLLESQLATLEEPSGAESAIKVDVLDQAEATIAACLAALEKLKPFS